MADTFEIPEDHDQRFKSLIRKFFADFLRLFFADWARRFDLSSIEWLDKELMPDPPGGSRHLLDLVAKLRTREAVEDGQTELLALVHIEVESADRTTGIKPRLPAYYLHLSDQYGLPVLPIALYMRVGLDGIGVDSVVRQFWDLEVLRMQYLYVGLPALDAEAYAASDNWLGEALSALMRVTPERAMALGRLALERLGGSAVTQQQYHLLGNCFVNYVPVGAENEVELRGIIQDESLRRASKMPLVPLRPDIEEIVKEGYYIHGRLEGILETRFGPLTPETLAKLRGLSSVRVRQLVTVARTAASLEELGL